MRLSSKQIGLAVGICCVLTSLLFFGRRQNIYLLASVFGGLIASICLVWILFGKESLRSKILSLGFVFLSIAVDLMARQYLIHLSYRLYVMEHNEVLSEVNKILSSKSENVWVIGDSIIVSKEEIMSLEDKRQLLKAKKQLGVYVISKTGDRIYYGLWGFLDARLGITYLPTVTNQPNKYSQPTGDWF
ncbi:hypothetical protein J2Y45_004168 [Dyadobacter sp. BE34]|uniref:Uncharacterized protein n=1 Tax=Dyadobacter fermentans TaxID=94254 RepID=A0ABU1R0P4_9BACT|nr:MULTISPECIES: hypothetical protein [Dyadobacter]MDR6806976.1 hypothetical protein [Dyadobacter fermentans]MDR7044718.1 hypothetical protein [Dyadobacter sp. BE242]MDR7199028.1 hypothetical protein [Dyadobacter sp. BE34]MDR7216990.1 hypothetical protein [Dyadobacter sp. BE31]MDR7263484.1 hypothetical protein [Dyadobacter sp. BE32]